MQVVKRDGTRQPVNPGKIVDRIRRLCHGFSDDEVDPALVAGAVAAGLHDGVTTRVLDELAAETAAYMETTHGHGYAVLGKRIAVSSLHKDTPGTFAEAMTLLWKEGLVCKLVKKWANRHSDIIEATIDYDRDYGYDYFGFRTLTASYLLRSEDGRIVERPQHALMRVALGIWAGAPREDALQQALATYDLMSRRRGTHASATLFNAGTMRPQCSSCFLMEIPEDSTEGIYDALKQAAIISRSAGGIGMSCHRVRSRGSPIKGWGRAGGMTPVARLFDAQAQQVMQGGGKRKSAEAVYMPAWHADVFEFLSWRKNQGKEEMRARSLKHGLWLSDLFMKRVKAEGDWSLFSPALCGELSECCGQAFEQMYEMYESEGKAVRTVKAIELWDAIRCAQQETSLPYMLYKDACNAKSNQRHLGTIKCSNLCCEIVQFSSPDEIAVCNLASVSLPACVDDVHGGGFDHGRLERIVRQLVRNLNRIIDVNHYPLPEARVSNMRHRPMGIGVQGLADVFSMLRIPFDGPEARALNRDIFETMYWAALSESVAEAERAGAPYESYPGSPLSRGQLSPDMWGVEPESQRDGRLDWAGLRASLREHGARNSLLIALMPTATTAQIMGNSEAFYPHVSNIFMRRVLAGEFICVNRHLRRELESLGLWTRAMRERIIADGGSVQAIEEIPAETRYLFRTVWEMSQRTQLDMCAERAPYVDQSQSFNLYLAEPTRAQLDTAHFYAWGLGLKTGMYYLRTKAAADAVKVTVAPSVAAFMRSRANAGSDGGDVDAGDAVCSRDDPDCPSCSS